MHSWFHYGEQQTVQSHRYAIMLHTEVDKSYHRHLYVLHSKYVCIALYLFEHGELFCGFTWLIFSCKLQFSQFSYAKFNSVIIYGGVDLLFSTRTFYLPVVYSVCPFVMFYRRWFLNHSAGNLHGERMYSSQHSGLLWQLPLVWPKHRWFVWVMWCLVTLFTGSGLLPFCHVNCNFWCLVCLFFLLKNSTYLQISQWANGVKIYLFS